MANYFSQWLRKRELKGLLRDIDRDYPELAVHQGENKIFHYLVVAVDDFTKAEQAYDQAPDKMP